MNTLTEILKAKTESLKGQYFAQMNNKEQITALRQTAVGRSASTPLERCWALRNYIGTLTVVTM